MQGVQKIAGIFALAAFALVAGSVVCLASGQPSVMADCGNQMNGAAFCPFMSASIPTVASAIVVLAAIFVIVATIRISVRPEAAALAGRANSFESPPRAFLDSTLELISRGVLHSRVFGF